MPNQQQNPRRMQSAASTGSTSLVKLIIVFLVIIIALLGLAALIAWLIIRPKDLVFSVENGFLQDFVIKNDHLNAKFNFVVRAYNPNQRMSVYYDHIDMSVGSEGQKVAYTTLSPFFQRRRNTTSLETNLSSRDVALSQDLSRDLAAANKTGEAKLNVWMRAKIRYKVGVIKSHDTLEIFCPNLMVPISSSYKEFQRVDCDVDD